MNFNKTLSILGVALMFACNTQQSEKAARLNISGVYPHLAHYNDEGECGHGAVVPWAGSLWTVTYGPHLPFGSSDRLYQITPDLEQVVRNESIGGTPANRMIHNESNQLFIGPYAIDGKGSVRVIPYSVMPGRHTGNARHLTNPADKIYYGTMEEGFYEVDVKSLAVKMLYEDGNVKQTKENDTQNNHVKALLPGAHGKGLYSGQGVLVYSNNGEPGQAALEHFDIQSGSLSEWDGVSWRTVRRSQFVEITGPGGIYGNSNPASDPIWATGFDHKSLLLAVRDTQKGWSFFRMPKASYTYDGAHGWNTEWPRIRNVGTDGKPFYLMTMHGMFWRFPATFSADNSADVRPLSAYLKVIGDFTRWGTRLVFGCDDSAEKEFLNKRKAKGGIEGPGQSNSNLWFTPLFMPWQLGPTNAAGYVWRAEEVEANVPSEPFLFAGWTIRSAWVKNAGRHALSFKFETNDGHGQWTALKSVSLEPGASQLVPFATSDAGEWIRVTSDKSTLASVAFVMANAETRGIHADSIFHGLSTIVPFADLVEGQPIRTTTELQKSVSLGGLLYGLGHNRRALGILANTDGKETGYYEADEQMRLVRKTDDSTASFIREKFAIPQQAVTIDEGSVLIVDDKGRCWRLPLGNTNFTGLTNVGQLRICREVATERDLFNCHGTFYELPAENADGYAKIRPVASHGYCINDYASYRGLLILSGIDTARAAGNPHIFISPDRKAAVWAGVIDDLWKLGKPVGRGGPWIDSLVKAGIASDPYLIGFYTKLGYKLSYHRVGN